MVVRHKYASPGGGTAAWHLLVLALVCVGCDATPTIVLARIDSVEPSVLEPDEVLEITGDGFVEGPVEVSFDGRFDPLGMVEATHGSVQLKGIAVSENTIQIHVTNTSMEKLAREPLLFEGMITATFPTSLEGSATRIGARKHGISLELRPAGGGVELEARRSREAEHILATLGITLEPSSRGDELLVSTVTPGSGADRHGMSPGDHLLSVDATALATASDIAGLDISSPHRFEFISPSGNIQTANIRIGPYTPVEMDEFAAIVITSLALGIFLLFALPRFHRGRQRLDGPKNPIALAMGMAVVSIPIVIVPAAAILTRADMGFALGLMGATIASLVVAGLYGRGRYRILSVLGRALPVPLVLIMAGAQGSTFGLWNTVVVQASSPWGWHSWSNPFALMTVLVSISIIWPRDDVHEETVAARAATWIAAVCTSIVITAYTLGGWTLPAVSMKSLSVGALPLLFGILVFFVKAWLVILAGRWMSGAGTTDRRSRRKAATMMLSRIAALLVLGCGALAWSWSPIPDDLQAAGRVLSGGVSLALATAFVASRLRAALDSRTVPEEPARETG